MSESSTSKEPLHVLMINKYGPAVRGGIEVHADQLCRSLAETGKVEVELVVASTVQKQNVITSIQQTPGYQLTTLPRKFELASTPYASDMAHVIAERADWADVVHMHYPYPLGDAAYQHALALAPQLKEVPLVVTFHSDIVRQKHLLKLYRPLMHKTFASADAIIVPSPQLKERAEQLEGFRDKCHVVNFGVDVSRYDSTPDVVSRGVESRVRCGIDLGAPVVLFVGRLVYYKGIDILLDAMAQISHSEAHLVIVGSGKLERKLKSQALQLGIADKVHFVGSVDDDELIAWYNTASFLVLPSTAESEAFGIVQLEAHAAGIPTICSDLSTGIAYATLDGVDGLHTATGDTSALAQTIDILLSDDVTRIVLGHAANKRARVFFSSAHMVGCVIKVYEHVIQEKQTYPQRRE